MSSDTQVDLTYRPITPRFGAELNDAVLLDMSDDEVEALQQLAAERGVVVCRGQTMSVHQQADFAHRLGPLTNYPVRDESIPSELLVIHADENSKHVAGSGWHTNISSEQRPPSLSMFAHGDRPIIRRRHPLLRFGERRDQRAHCSIDPRSRPHHLAARQWRHLIGWCGHVRRRG